jgi:hypothetical protein
MDETLQQYVASSRAAGVPDSETRAGLLTAGWGKDSVDEAMAMAAAPIPATPPAAAPQAGATASGGQVRAFNPHAYAVIGFFFSIIPVAIMSLANGKVLAGGEVARKKMKVLLLMFIVLSVISLALTFGTAWYVARASRDAIAANPSILFSGSQGITQAIDAKLRMAKTFNQVSGYVIYIFNLFVLVMAVRTTNRLEVPSFNTLRAAGTVKKRNPFLPILAGIGFIVAYTAIIVPLLSFATVLGLAR